MINDYEEYELVKTITLDTPTETEVVKPDATFRCSVSLEDTGNTSWFCINEMGKVNKFKNTLVAQKECECGELFCCFDLLFMQSKLILVFRTNNLTT